MRSTPSPRPRRQLFPEPAGSPRAPSWSPERAWVAPVIACTLSNAAPVRQGDDSSSDTLSEGASREPGPACAPVQPCGRSAAAAGPPHCAGAIAEAVHALAACMHSLLPGIAFAPAAPGAPPQQALGAQAQPALELKQPCLDVACTGTSGWGWVKPGADAVIAGGAADVGPAVSALVSTANPHTPAARPGVIRRQPRAPQGTHIASAGQWIGALCCWSACMFASWSWRHDWVSGHPVCHCACMPVATAL